MLLSHIPSAHHHRKSVLGEGADGPLADSQGRGSAWQVHSPKGVAFPEPVGRSHHLAHRAESSQSQF